MGSYTTTKGHLYQSSLRIIRFVGINKAQLNVKRRFDIKYPVARVLSYLAALSKAGWAVFASTTLGLSIPLVSRAQSLCAFIDIRIDSLPEEGSSILIGY